MANSSQATDLSTKFIVFLEKESASTSVINFALEQAFNSQSWGKAGTVCDIGNITVDNTTFTNFTITNIIVALPEVTITNDDNSTQTLRGIEVKIGSIAQNIQVGATETITAFFQVTNDTNTVPSEDKSFNSTIYPVRKRTTQGATVAYTTSSQDVSMDLFSIKNLGNGNFKVFASSTAQASLPFACKISDTLAYKDIETIADNQLIPMSVVRELTQNSEWHTRVEYVDGNTIEVHFDQVGKTYKLNDAGTANELVNTIPSIQKDLSGFTSTGTYHVFLQYKNVNNTIEDIEISVSTSLTGELLAQDIVQQRIFSYYVSGSAIEAFTNKDGVTEYISDVPVSLPVSSSSASLNLNVPRDIPLENSFKVPEIADLTQLQIAQYNTDVNLITGKSFVTSNGSISFKNTSGDSRTLYQLSYTDLTASIVLKGKYIS